MAWPFDDGARPVRRWIHPVRAELFLIVVLITEMHMHVQHLQNAISEMRVSPSDQCGTITCTVITLRYESSH